MKKSIITLLTLALCFTLWAEQETITFPMGTNSIATLTLDTRKGTNTPLPIVGLNMVRMDLTAPGGVANTNGNFVVYFETARSRTGPYTLWSDSNIKLQSTLTGIATNAASDKFDLTGIQWMRVGAVSNSGAGTLTNFSVQITYPQPSSHQ